jgi:hypothetical protein
MLSKNTWFNNGVSAASEEGLLGTEHLPDGVRRNKGHKGQYGTINK